MRASLALSLSLALGVAEVAAAASNVSSKYDGVYSGAAMPARTGVQSECAEFAVGNITIAGGIFKSPASQFPKVSGFVTEEGYVASFLTRSGHGRSAMDGRIVDGVIVAGLIEEDSGCMWTVRLEKQGGP